MNLTEYNATRAKAMTEAELQREVIALAKFLGWRTWHATIAFRSAPGFPDLVLVHPKQKRVLWRELKTQTGRVTPSQQQWLDDLDDAGEDAGVWRPQDLVAGTVELQLRTSGQGDP